MSIYCYNCGEEIDELINYCPECGENQNQSEVTKRSASVEQTNNAREVPEPTITFGGFEIDPKISFNLIWIGAVVAVGSILAEVIALSVVGYAMSMIGIWTDAEYATQVSDEWEPNKILYTAGAFLLMIVALPLYFYRRSKYL